MTRGPTGSRKDRRKSSRQEEETDTATPPGCVCGPEPPAEGTATPPGCVCGPEPPAEGTATPPGCVCGPEERGGAAEDAAVKAARDIRRSVRTLRVSTSAASKLTCVLQVGFDLTQLGLSLTLRPMKSGDPRVPRVPLPILTPGIPPGINPSGTPNTSTTSRG